MLKFEDPLATAKAIVTDLPGRVIDTIKKNDLKAIAALYNDLFCLQACVEQLAKEKK